MELDKQVDAFAARGLNVAAISYDPPAVLKYFRDKRKLRYPLLSDEGSKIIRAFGILNESVKPDAPVYGIPHPGTFIIDPAGVVKSKYFEDNYTERTTGSAILVKEFGAAAGGAGSTIETRHLKLTASSSAGIVRGGQKVMLIVDVELKKKMHVYAPGAAGYKSIDWKSPASELYRMGDLAAPPAKTLYLKAIKEKVPVYLGSFRLTRDVTLGNQKALKAASGEAGEITIESEFLYQACDDKVCYPPETVPLRWKVLFEGHDSERAPKELRKF